MTSDSYEELSRQYEMYEVYSYGYKLNVRSLVTWPWASRAEVYIDEAVYSLDGEIDSSYMSRTEAEAQGMLEPPTWKNATYKVVLIKPVSYTHLDVYKRQRCMKARSAIMLSAVFNFLGVLIMTHINSSVAFTISNMVDFGGNSQEALIALCAALFSIVVYSVAASWFGIPTSESHSLIAGLSGAAIAIHNGIGGINLSEWVKVIYLSLIHI